MSETCENSVSEPIAAVSLPVDLSREEYIRFNLIMSRLDGRNRRVTGYFAVSAVSCILCLGMMWSDWYTSGIIDPFMILMFFTAVGMGVISRLSMTSRIRGGASRSYDETLMNGQSFYGQIDVFPDRVEKSSENRNVKIRFDGDVRYVETNDMMIFLSAEAPAIILPARCVTPENAGMIRQLVRGAVPAWRQKLFSVMIPVPGPPVYPPVTPADDDNTAGVNVRIDYSRKETRTMLIESVMQQLSGRLIGFCAFSLIAALIVSMMSGFGAGILTFLLTLAGVIGFPLITGNIAINRRFANEDEPPEGISVRVTESGLILRTPDRRNPRYIGWHMVSRGVERPLCMDFYVSGMMIRIPKRCMNESMTENIREIANRHLHKQ